MQVTPLSPAPRPTVLLIEDHDDTREMYAYYLSLVGGLEVVDIAGPTDALDVALKVQPDIIVTSDALGRFGAVAVCRTLHAEPATSHIPVIILTARAMPAALAEMRAASADVLIKPCLPEDLLARVRAVATRG